MPAYQSVTEFALSEKYHLKGLRCKKCAAEASDRTIEQEWQELAAQWHLMADQAAKISAEASQPEPAVIRRPPQSASSSQTATHT